MAVMITVFREVTPCYMIDRHRRFVESYYCCISVYISLLFYPEDKGSNLVTTYQNTPLHLQSKL